MKTLSRITLVTTVSFAALAGCGGPADGVTTSSEALEVSLCQSDLQTLKERTVLAHYTSTKDRDFLVVKLDNASAKLGLGKLADAVQKLTDYELKVQALELEGKISPSDDGVVTAQTLVAGAQAAIDCINTP